MIHSDARQLAYGERRWLRRSVSRYQVCPRGRPTHSLDLHCHYDINEMPLKRCVCSVTRGPRGGRDGEIDVKPT